jgi:hypothetical protein
MPRIALSTEEISPPLNAETADGKMLKQEKGRFFERICG